MPKKTKTPKPAGRIEVGESNVHGRGVYAAQFIPKGTRVIEYTGQRISWERAPDDESSPAHIQFRTGKRRSNQSRDWRQRRALDQPLLRSELRSDRGRRPNFYLRDTRHRTWPRTLLRLRNGNRRTDHRRNQKEIRMPLR